MKINKHKINNPSFKERLKKKARHILTLDSILTFGMYKGETLQSAISANPSYVKYMVDQDYFVIDRRAEEYLYRHLREEAERKQRARERERRAQEEREERESQERARRNHSEDARRYAGGFTDENEGGFDWRDFMGDFFSRHQRRQSQQPPRTEIDESKLHPAYKWDNLPESVRYGKILRLKGQVTLEDIKSQYRKLAIIFHPDKNGQLDEILQETARIMFLQVQKAYEYFERRYGK